MEGENEGHLIKVHEITLFSLGLSIFHESLKSDPQPSEELHENDIS